MSEQKPSWQSRFASAYVRTFLRRSDWGDENAVARRARRLFGAPKAFQWLKSRGLRIENIETGRVRGEWIFAEDAADIVLYIHGGGFVSGSPARHRPVTASLARLGKFKVFSVDYRLAPEDRFPAALEDTVAAYRWLLEQNISPGRIAFAGDSAGGGLVLSTLLKLRDNNLPFPACAVCFSPWTDLAGTGDSVKSNDGKDAMFCPQNISQFAAAYLGDSSPLDPYASPVLGDFDSSFPPILFQVGTTELLVDDSRRIHERVQKANGVSKLEMYVDVPHCWQMFDSLIPEARIALQKAVEFIHGHVTSSANPAFIRSR